MEKLNTFCSLEHWSSNMKQRKLWNIRNQFKKNPDCFPQMDQKFLISGSLVRLARSRRRRRYRSKFRARTDAWTLICDQLAVTIWCFRRNQLLSQRRIWGGVHHPGCTPCGHPGVQRNTVITCRYPHKARTHAKNVVLKTVYNVEAKLIINCFTSFRGAYQCLFGI